MASDNELAPIIIKRKKVSGGDGHHGGAWKVAYADFVTAMMAFFLLMWLLNATTEKQRKGIADYFTPTIAIARVSGGGSGALGGDSVFAQNTLPRIGTGSTSLRPASENGETGAYSTPGDSSDADDTGEVEEEQFEEVEELLMGRGGESMLADETLEHIVTRVTDEGLIVELYETEVGRLFDERANPTPLLEQLALMVVRAAEAIPNQMAVEGHTPAYPRALAEDPAWTLSAERAAAFQSLLVAYGLDAQRVNRLTSHGDREPTQDNPMSIRNSRIEIVFLRDV